MKGIPRVEGVILKDVGVFDRLAVEFPAIPSPSRDAKKAEIHIFTGPNGCGKSTLLYAIADLFSAIGPSQPPLQARLRGEASSVEYRFDGGLFRESTDGIGITQLPTQRYFDGEFGRYQSDSGQYGSILQRWDGVENPAAVTANLVGYRNIQGVVGIDGQPNTPPMRFAVFAYAGQKNTASGNLGAIQEIHNSPFENALGFDGAVRPELFTQWVANNRTDAALARDQKEMKDAAAADRSLRRITDFIATVCDLNVEFRLTRKPLAVTTSVNGREVKFSVLPDGLKSIISWVADLTIRLESIVWASKKDVFSQPIILLLDEIDIYLHPKWQRRILPALQALLPNAQIFVSTHSPFVVGSVEDAFVYKLGEQDANGLLRHESGGAGKSYEAILDEIFDVEERFDLETESLFKDFYKVRAGVLANKDEAALDRLAALAGRLIARGEEVAVIVRRELRQVERVIGKEVAVVPFIEG